MVTLAQPHPNLVNYKDFGLNCNNSNIRTVWIEMVSAIKLLGYMIVSEPLPFCMSLMEWP